MDPKVAMSSAIAVTTAMMTRFACISVFATTGAVLVTKL